MALLDTLKTSLGSAWHTNSDAFLALLASALNGTGLDVTPGTVSANLAIVAGPTKNVDTLDVAALKLNGVALTSNAGQLNLPDAQYSTAALQTAPLPAANIAGANLVAFENTGTTPGTLTTDTAVAIVAAMPGAVIGQTYVLKIRNSSGSANTATIAGGTGVTMHGTLTIAQNVTREFLVKLTSLTAVDMFSMGVSAAAA